MQTKTYTGKNNEVIMESNAIIERWEEYFEDLENPQHQHETENK